MCVGEDLEDDQAGKGLPALEYSRVLEPQHREDIFVDVETAANDHSKQQTCQRLHLSHSDSYHLETKIRIKKDGVCKFCIT